MKFFLLMILSSFFSASAIANTKPIDGNCSKNNIHNAQKKKESVESDRKAYQSWCKKHPHQCPKRKMF